MSLETSHSRVLYSRALELIARAGIDLNDVSMDDSINDAQLLAADEEAGIEQGAPADDGDGDDSDVSNSSASWDRHSASAREIVFPTEEAEVDVNSSTYSSDADTVSVQSKRSAAAAARKIGAELSVAELLEHVEADSPYVLASCDGGYTTNVPLEDLVDGRAWVVDTYDGEPLAPEHGGPARLLVPHLYFWKSAKWLRRLSLLEQDEPGFWETFGYHNYGDPWREQRYSDD